MQGYLVKTSFEIASGAVGESGAGVNNVDDVVALLLPRVGIRRLVVRPPWPNDDPVSRWDLRGFWSQEDDTVHWFCLVDAYSDDACLEHLLNRSARYA